MRKFTVGYEACGTLFEVVFIAADFTWETAGEFFRVIDNESDSVVFAVPLSRWVSIHEFGE